jgi:hypothetical protein
MLMREVLTMLNQNWDLTSPYQRSLIVTQLLERVMKLDQYLEPYRPPRHENIFITRHKPTIEEDDDEFEDDE